MGSKDLQGSKDDSDCTNVAIQMKNDYEHSAALSYSPMLRKKNKCVDENGEENETERNASSVIDDAINNMNNLTAELSLHKSQRRSKMKTDDDSYASDDCSTSSKLTKTETFDDLVNLDSDENKRMSQFYVPMPEESPPKDEKPAPPPKFKKPSLKKPSIRFKGDILPSVKLTTEKSEEFHSAESTSPTKEISFDTPKKPKISTSKPPLPKVSIRELDPIIDPIQRNPSGLNEMQIMDAINNSCNPLPVKTVYQFFVRNFRTGIL